MNAKSWWVRIAACGLLAAVVSVAALSAQAAPETLATVRIPQGVTANGQPLPAGSYTVRVSSEAVTPVVGQGPEAARWVEFVQNGQVRGKELASVVAPADVKAVAKRTPPAEGRGLVHVLRGAEYVRVWVNHDGAQYLVHLTVTPR
ncbi:MAG: hypothetical protein IT183_02350 [Acidobacteria bacterium]|nr:hypothetical protein [Acidobacteriota bacterium]